MQRSASSAPSHERTNAQIYDAYGQAIATLALRGQAPYQVSSRASRPESRALSSDGNSGVYPGALRLAPPLSVRPYSLSTGLFLRAYARAHRLAHPQFVSPSQALTLVRIHFGPEHPVTRRGARSIELPRKSSVLRVPTVLTESGSNFDDLGRSVSGRAGDVRRDSTGTSVVRPIAFGSLSTCPDDVHRDSPAWRRFLRQSRSNRVFPVSQTFAIVPPPSTPSREDGLLRVKRMVDTASARWGVEFRDAPVGRGFSRQADGDGNPVSVVALPAFDQDAVARGGGPWASHDAYLSHLVVETSHACGYEQARRDPQSRPDPLRAHSSSSSSSDRSAFVREDMVAHIAALEFITGAGFTFTPLRRIFQPGSSDVQARALLEPGGYEGITSSASRSLRMLCGLEPTRDEERALRGRLVISGSQDVDDSQIPLPLGRELGFTSAGDGSVGGTGGVAGGGSQNNPAPAEKILEHRPERIHQPPLRDAGQRHLPHHLDPQSSDERKVVDPHHLLATLPLARAAGDAVGVDRPSCDPGKRPGSRQPDRSSTRSR